MAFPVSSRMTVNFLLLALSPSREAQPGARAGGGAVAGDVFEPVEVEMLDRASERHPVEDFRAAGVELVAGEIAQERGVLVGAGLEDRAVEVLVHQEMAQAAGGENADARRAGEIFHRLANGLAKLVAAARPR